MRARADATVRTRDRIIDAMLRRYAELPYDRIRLEDVAGDAEVTVQTVVRHFGGKAGLLVATVERALARLFADRDAALGAPPEAMVGALVRHYEEQGALILKLYAEAHQAAGVPELAARGRQAHIAWCREAFAGAFAHLDQETRERRLAQVVAICDATTWRILRFDCQLTPAQTEQALTELMGPVLTATQRTPEVPAAPSA